MRLLRALARGRGTTSRRALLKALGVSAAAAPFVPALDGWAAGAAPKRLVLLFSPHGVIPETYWPTGADTNFTFPAGGILEPFTPLKTEMTIFKGLRRNTTGKGEHEIAMANLWTGTSMALPSQDANGPSIDQIVAKAIKPDTTFESLQLGVQCPYWGEGDITSKAGSPNSSMINAGPHQRLYPENDPQKLFDRLFSGGMAAAGAGNMADADRLRSERKSILDFVRDELTDLDGKVGKNDKLKIAAHLEGTRDVERRLQQPATMCGAVTKPDGSIDLGANANHPKLIPLMNQLVVAALACDRTRIASLQYSRSFSMQRHVWLGSNEGHHTLSHNAGAKKMLSDIQRFYFTHLASFVSLLKNTTEGGQSLLDNTLVVYSAELYTSWDHARDPSVSFFVGKAGGAIKPPGRIVDFGGNNDHNQFLTTIGRAMGVTTLNKVGDLGKEGILPGVLG